MMLHRAHEACEHLSRSQTGREVLSVSWQDIDDLTCALAEHIKQEGLPDLLVGLERGGLIPAVMLSHQLGVRSLLSVPVQRTCSDTIYAEKQRPHVLLEPHRLFTLDTRDVLVVDDIAGSGQSLLTVLPLLSHDRPTRLRSAVYVVNRQHWDAQHGEEPAQIISYIGREVRGWAVFPWEKRQDGD